MRELYMSQITRNDSRFIDYINGYFDCLAVCSISTYCSESRFGGFGFTQTNGKVHLYAFGVGKWCSAELLRELAVIPFNELGVDRWYAQILKTNIRANVFAQRGFFKVRSSTAISTLYEFDSDSLHYFSLYAFTKERRKKLREFNALYNRK